MKVLIVNEKYPPYISGGAERSVQILAEKLPTSTGYRWRRSRDSKDG